MGNKLVEGATSPRFDWYSGSFEGRRDILGTFEALVDETPRPCRPRMGFQKAYELRRAGCTVARVMAGTRHEMPYVEASGEDAGDLAELLRSERIEHIVARVDACSDVQSPGAFVGFERALMEQLPQRVTRTQFVKTQDGVAASTLYLGSRKSEAFARVYEKGKESPDTHHEDTVRVEVQARPKGARKSWAAGASPHEIMSLPGWAGVLLGLVGMGQLPTPARAERMTDLDGALAAMVKQYGRRVDELVELHSGDVDAAFEDLRELFGYGVA